MLSVFRRRDACNDADIVTLDTRWSDAAAVPRGASAIVESMSADFTVQYCHCQRELSGDQHARYGARTVTTMNDSKVRKSHSLHNSAHLATDDVTSHTHCQTLNQCPLTERCRHADDDDIGDKLGASTHSGSISDDRCHHHVSRVHYLPRDARIQN